MQPRVSHQKKGPFDKKKLWKSLKNYVVTFIN